MVRGDRVSVPYVHILFARKNTASTYLEILNEKTVICKNVKQNIHSDFMVINNKLTIYFISNLYFYRTGMMNDISFLIFFANTIKSQSICPTS